MGSKFVSELIFASEGRASAEEDNVGVMGRKFLLVVIKRRQPITMTINHGEIITQSAKKLAIQINKCEATAADSAMEFAG
ncbi:hypothetical protein ACS77B_15170 [Yersinia enterocolitica]|uniref:hypothetical protein n=1 Tax=Yersinia enterocolitica TaxID=630 RepID=UPI003F440CE6